MVFYSDDPSIDDVMIRKVSIPAGAEYKGVAFDAVFDKDAFQAGWGSLEHTSGGITEEGAVVRNFHSGNTHPTSKTSSPSHPLTVPIGEAETTKTSKQGCGALPVSVSAYP